MILAVLDFMFWWVVKHIAEDMLHKHHLNQRRGIVNPVVKTMLKVIIVLAIGVIVAQVCSENIAVWAIDYIVMAIAIVVAIWAVIMDLPDLIQEVESRRWQAEQKVSLANQHRSNNP
ncbi:MAG TPA: hypothetical protein VLF68_02145 [Candidatus Saccharimonadales bacterium]|nr:hypothetical protein [Candidatus Saccharimonadales bacterium]